MISLPICKNISAYAFYPYNDAYDMALSKIIAPQCENIEDYAFYSCSNLSSFDFTSTLQHIGYRAFAKCGTGIENFPFELLNTIVSIDPNVFASGTLSKLSHSTLTYVPIGAFE